MLTCKQMTELVTDCLEGKLSIWQRLMFQMHLGMCKHCRAYVRQMKATIAAVGHLPDEPIDPKMHEELMRRFENWKSK